MKCSKRTDEIGVYQAKGRLAGVSGLAAYRGGSRQLAISIHGHGGYSALGALPLWIRSLRQRALYLVEPVAESGPLNG
jgi:hypothetical protein